MTTRGGKRDNAGKYSRSWKTTKITVYAETRENLKQLSERLKMPVVEIIYRILNHKDFEATIEDIENNKVDNWHEQSI